MSPYDDAGRSSAIGRTASNYAGRSSAIGRTASNYDAKEKVKK